MWTSARVAATKAGGKPLMGADMKRDVLRKTILELLRNGNMHYTDLEKKVNASGHSFATTNTFRSQFNYLLNNCHIIRVRRGIYQITSRGKNYLILLEDWCLQ